MTNETDLKQLSSLFSRRFLLLGAGSLVFLYALTILLYVPTVPDLGLRSVFSTTLKRAPLHRCVGEDGLLPQKGDQVVQVGNLPIRSWGDLLKAPFAMQSQKDAEGIEAGTADWAKWAGTDSGEAFLVKTRFLRPETGQEFTAWCELGRLPFEELYPSVLWFFLKAFLFLVGALVFWKRPHDDAARVFFLLCVVTLGAYMGGYHWNHIATSPAFILVFMVCGMLLPVVSLHFYQLFPRKKTWAETHPRRTLALIYGLPLLVLALMLVRYFQMRWLVRYPGTAEALLDSYDRLREAIYASFGVSALWYLGCTVSLLHSFWTVREPSERNQVKCILFIGVAPALFLIGYSLYIVVWDPDAFAAGGTTWPMFFASACINVAFVVSITRYRLMELDKLISSGMAYFLVSFLALLLYYAVVFLGTVLFNQVLAGPSFGEAFGVSATFLLLMVVLDLARSRFKKALDVRFSRNKSQLDRTLRQMSEAVAQLVDPPALAQRLLHASADLLGAARGAVYLRDGGPARFRLAGHVGAAPPLDELAADFPLVEAVATGLTLYPTAEKAPAFPVAAQRQLHLLGGELAQPLTHEGRLLGLLVLGPRDTPYRPEDVHTLAALAQITVVALESAAGHRTIEQLNGELQDKVAKIAEQQRRILALQTQLRQNFDLTADRKDEPPAAPNEPASLPGGIIGTSPVLRDLLGLVRKVAVTDAVVLIRGESGTGKELLARAVHETSGRADKPFVKVHCAALSPGLLESELFGHVKGAFTGAHRDKVGRFELAHGGTLFLDEIGDITLEVQTKLLRVLQERTFERVGSSEPMQADVRIITATHQDLEGLIRQGKFREDLFYRLNVFPVRVPALRERAEDVPELVLHFVRRVAERIHKPVPHVDDDALAVLKSQPWPGNIRQLENIVERAVVIAEGDVITVHELPAELFQEQRVEPTSPGVTGPPSKAVVRPDSNWRSERDRAEREQLTRALAAAGGNKAEAARALGVARSTLVSRLKKLGLA